MVKFRVRWSGAEQFAKKALGVGKITAPVRGDGFIFMQHNQCASGQGVPRGLKARLCHRVYSLIQDHSPCRTRACSMPSVAHAILSVTSIAVASRARSSHGYQLSGERVWFGKNPGIRVLLTVQAVAGKLLPIMNFKANQSL
jgi:hypothetical protein